MSHVKETCLLCATDIECQFSLDHALMHLDCNLFKCGFNNCQAEFQTEIQLKLHCSWKHKDACKVSNLKLHYAFVLHVFL